MDHCHTRTLSEVRAISSTSIDANFGFIELIAIVRHMQAYPSDDLDDTLRNVFDFDVYRAETVEKLDEILRKHRFVYASSTRFFLPQT